MTTNLSNKQIFVEFNQKLNDMDLEGAAKYLADDVRKIVFNPTRGKFEIIGSDKESVMFSFHLNYEEGNDIRFDIEEIIEDSHSLCAIGNLKASVYDIKGPTGIQMVKTKPFSIKTLVIVKFHEHRISYIEFFWNTWEFMKVNGSAILNSKDQPMIENYLDELKTNGIIPKDYS